MDDAQGRDHRRVQVNDKCHRPLELLAIGYCRQKVGVTGQVGTGAQLASLLAFTRGGFIACRSF